MGVHWVGQLVADTVRFLAPHSPCEVEASQKVWVGLNVQRSQKRHVLHLVNWETSLLARNVTISVAGNADVGRRATQVWPVRRPLRSEPHGGGFMTRIPEVGPHVIVLFE